MRALNIIIVGVIVANNHYHWYCVILTSGINDTFVSDHRNILLGQFSLSLCFFKHLYSGRKDIHNRVEPGVIVLS